MAVAALVSTKFGPIIVNPNDFVISRSIMEGGYWAIQDVNLLLEIIEKLLLQKRDIIFYDVGANLGTHTLAVAKTFGEKVRVRSFEAQRVLYYMLCGTVALNGLENVWCENVIVDECSDVGVELFLPDYRKQNNLGSFEVRPPVRTDNETISRSGFETVFTRTVDSYQDRVDIMKVDIEGMEDRAIRGAASTIEKHRPVCMVEFYKTDVKFIFDYFRSLSYRGYRRGADVVVIPGEMEFGLISDDRIF
jgi:FkbM family methyltransferase